GCLSKSRMPGDDEFEFAGLVIEVHEGPRRTYVAFGDRIELPLESPRGHDVVIVHHSCVEAATIVEGEIPCCGDPTALLMEVADAGIVECVDSLASGVVVRSV